MFEHLEETAAGDGVYAGSRFVQEIHRRVGHERNRATKFPLVAATQLPRLLFPKLTQVECLLDQLFLELEILGGETLDAPYHHQMLIHCQLIPEEVGLGT